MAEPSIDDLLAAAAVVGRDLDLPAVLERIVSAACALSGARYGALGVLSMSPLDGSRQRLSAFITYGIDEPTRLKIGDLPVGSGILGVLIDDPRPLRLLNIAAHPRSSGWPANHPPMTTFLGVPIRVGDAVFGNLYLTEKNSGPFTESDEERIKSLAIAAGVAIEHARLYSEVDRRRRWAEAGSEIGAAISGRLPAGEALSFALKRTCQVAHSDWAVIGIADAAGSFVVSQAVGSPPLHARAFIDDVPANACTVSLRGPGDRPAVLVLCPADPNDAPELAMLGQLVSLAMGRLDAEAARAALAVVEDRERIARDLHDLVIQRLFATGLNLQAATKLGEPVDVRERIEGSIDDLDATIRDIRATIFALHQRDSRDIHRLVADLAAEASSKLGLMTTTTFIGPVESVADDQLRSDIAAVLTEAMSNAAKHGHASNLAISVSVVESWVRVDVVDDGQGFTPDNTVESGLANLRARAEQRGGSLGISEVHRPAGQARRRGDFQSRNNPSTREGATTGTRLRWQVPL